MKRLNLLPKELRAARPMWFGKSFPIEFGRGPALKAAAIVVVLLGLGIGGQMVATWKYDMKAYFVRKQMEQVRRLSAQSKTQQQALNVRRAGLESQRQVLDARRQALSRVIQPPVPFSAVLAELVELLPEQIWVSKLSFHAQRVQLSAVSKNPQAITDLMALLDGSRAFRDTTFTSVQRSEQDPEGLFRFEISTVPIQEDPKRPSG